MRNATGVGCCHLVDGTPNLGSYGKHEALDVCFGADWWRFGAVGVRP